jgi:hypothetical protein
MRTMKRVLALACVLAIPVHAAADEDRCRDVLEAAVHDIVVEQNGAVTNEATRDWFCSDRFSSYLRSSGSDLSLSLPTEDGPPISFGADSTSDDASEARERFCSESESAFSNEESELVFRQMVSPTVMSSWLACMRGQVAERAPSAVRGRAEREGETVIADVWWQPRSAEESAPRVIGLDAEGLDCDWSVIEPGVSLSVDPKSVTCRWKDGEVERGTLVVLATSGRWVETVERNSAGRLVGRAVLGYRPTSEQWQPAEPQTAMLRTGNHHCSSDCGGNPTRTNYEIVVRAPQGTRISSDPRAGLACVGGPCGGWLHVNGCYLRAEGREAVCSIDVWSRRTSWRLTVQTERLVTVAGDEQTSEHDLIGARTVVFEVPANATDAVIRMRMRDGSSFAIRPGSNGEGTPLAKTDEVVSGERRHFTYRVR